MTDYSILPEHMQDAMRRYVEHGIPGGQFLTAVLANNLIRACGSADDCNINRLPTYAEFLAWHAPADCYGSPEAVVAWVARGGLNGQEAA